MDRAPRPADPSASPPRPRELPSALAELCAHLEQRGLPTWVQGEGLLQALRPGPDAARPAAADVAADRESLGAPCALASPTWSLVCHADAEGLLRALPRAVVSAPDRGRLTQATAIGPVDLLPTGGHEPDDWLRNFGLSAYAIGFRPADAAWAGPGAALDATCAGRLDVVRPGPGAATGAAAMSPEAPEGAAAPGDTAGVFARTPRRYWLAARLLAEHALAPTPTLLAAARAGLPAALERGVPEGAPARRALARVLEAPSPGPGLAFLRESGLAAALLPDLDPGNEARIAHLPQIVSLRWTAWLRGTSTAAALVRLRMPWALARRIERLQALHPVDQSLPGLREPGLRRLLARVSGAELDGLFVWRRLELAEEPPSEGRRRREAALDGLEARLAEARRERARTGRVRRLALDGHAVMTILGAGPGPHVGRALAHLASHVESHPEDNERERLRVLLQHWAQEHADALGARPRRSARGGSIR